MKKILMVFLLITVASLFAMPGIAQQGSVSNAGAAYNPAITYAGGFKPSMLFFKNHPGNTVWRRLAHFDRLYKVTCKEALDSLNHSGTWQGHLNFEDGSCGGVEEPAAWATGNWRNYDMLRSGAGDQ